MEVGEQDVPRLEQRDFLRLRFLHLDDHVRRLEHGGGIGKDGRARFLVGGVGAVDAGAGMGLDHHFMAGGDQLGDRRGRQAHPIFVVLDFLGHADPHRSFAPSVGFAAAL